MNFVKHSNLEGLHAPFSASQSAWLRYDTEKALTVYDNMRAKERGTKLILWTCRTGKELEAALKWSSGHGIYFDAVNRNIPEIVESFGNDESRKIFAHEYIDDRARNIEDIIGGEKNG